MTAVARLAYAGGGGVFPADTAYERQLLRDHLLHRARRSRVVHLELAAQSWTIELTEAMAIECAGCGGIQPVYAVRRRPLSAARCLDCVLGLSRGVAADVERLDRHHERFEGAVRT